MTGKSTVEYYRGYAIQRGEVTMGTTEDIMRYTYGETNLPRPRLKGAEMIHGDEVSSSLIRGVEVWRAPGGYYFYYRYLDNHLTLGSGPHKRDSTALRHAKEAKEALKK